MSWGTTLGGGGSCDTMTMVLRHRIGMKFPLLKNDNYCQLFVLKFNIVCHPIATGWLAVVADSVILISLQQNVYEIVVIG